MMNRNQIAKRLKKRLPSTFQEPIIGYLGITSDANAQVIAGTSKIYVRLGRPDSPEYDVALIPPHFMSYYASYIRPNLKVELVRTRRGNLKVSGIDIYQEIANFSGTPPTPLIVIDVGSDRVTGIMPVDHGGSGADLSATGGSNRVVMQESAGADFTVRVLANADIPTALSGKIISTSTFTGDTVSDNLTFTEASTPSAPANTAGKLFAREVLSHTRFGYIDSNSIIIDISRDRTIEANNASGSTIAALRVARINGASGSTPFQPTITPAQGNSSANADGVLVVTMESINNGANGRVMLHGLMTADTSGFSGTGPVYIDPSSAGVLTLTKPTAPNVARRVGYILRVNASGLILIDPGEVDENTTYSVFTGASAGAAGTTGLVPQPIAGRQNYRLHGDATWKSIIVIDDDTSGTPIMSTTYAAVPEFVLRRSNGSLGAESQVTTDQVIAAFGGRGWHSGSGYSNTVAKIEYRATQSFTNIAQGTAIDFYTTANNATSPTRRGYFDQDGSFNVGNNTGYNPIVVRPGNFSADIFLGTGRTADGTSGVHFRATSGGGSNSATIERASGANGGFTIQNTGSGNVILYAGGANRVTVNGATGGVLVSDELEVDGALNHDGTTVGFFSVAPDTQPTSTEDIKDGFVRLGLMTDGGATPLATDNGFVDVGTSYFKVSAGSNAGNNRLWQDSTDKMLAWQTASGLKMLPGGVFWKMISAVSLVDATSETSITSGTTWGTLTVPANTGIAGTYFEFDFGGAVETTAGQLRFVIKLNGSTITNFQTAAIASAGAFAHFDIKIRMNLVNTSGTSNLVTIGTYNSRHGDTFAPVGVGAGNFDPASSNTFTFFAYFDGSPSSTTVTFRTGSGKIY
jgi:hypothetical protein